MPFTNAIPFRVQLLVAMMLIVAVVTGVTLYVAERSMRARHQDSLQARFQSEMRRFTEVQEVELSAIMEKCRRLSTSVRIRAALEERDVEDLYHNALTELQPILETQAPPSSGEVAVPQASFFRFLDADGTLLSPANEPPGLESLDATLASMRGRLERFERQAVGYVSLERGAAPSVLREVVLTKIPDWDGRHLGVLVLAFPVRNMTGTQEEHANAPRSGIWLSNRLYLEGLSGPDRHLVASRISEAMTREAAGHFRITIENEPHLLFYKALDPDTPLAPAYEVCLYPLATSLRELALMRWKIMGCGLAVLLLGFLASHFISKGLAEPVAKIVAGSAENLTRRRLAERDLREVNRELEKALAELKATQQQVIQQERLRALGQMASGIAHDFNNTLTPILGFSDLLLEKPGLLENQKDTRQFLGYLRTAARDAANVVERLRQFYRPLEQDEKFAVVDLNALARQVVLLTEPKWRGQSQAKGATVYVKTNLQSIPAVAADESALREVLTNLIFNAVDAMPAGGEITLETAAESECSVLRVRDSGMGMTEEVRQRCLEPFFSTKGENGTGLGLSMVYGIIERHRGTIEVVSAPGEGTTFTIRLPIATGAVVQPLAPVDAKPIAALNVLVVDDELPVREVISAYLRSDGHDVTTANSGREGLEQFAARPFDLVVTDRAMPEMSGDQMAGFIKQVRPEMPIVLLTGFGALIEVTGEQPKDVDVVLNKPVTLRALRQTIENLLHAA